MANWFTPVTPDEQARLVAAWPGAPIENVELCSFLLDVAREQVLAYAPSVDEEVDTTAVNVVLTLEDGEVVATDLTFSADVEPDYTGTLTLPLSARGLRVEATYDDGELVGTALTTAAELVPQRYVYAQLQQAKNLWSAGMADQDGNVGAEGYSFQPRPLDKTIRQIIRPTTGAASVF